MGYDVYMQYTLRQISEKLGVSVYTVRYWVSSGKITTVRTLGGHHRITQKELDRLYAGQQTNQDINVVIYSRVSSSENKKNLESQAKRLSDYSIAKGYTIKKIIKEVGSGVNDNRKKLAELMDYVTNEPVDKVVVEHKDRLTRFGFVYLEKYFKQNTVEIEIVNESTNGKEDLMEDFVSIITSFVARLYGLRKSKRKTEKLIRELTSEDN